MSETITPSQSVKPKRVQTGMSTLEKTMMTGKLLRGEYFDNRYRCGLSFVVRVSSSTN